MSQRNLFKDVCRMHAAEMLDFLYVAVGAKCKVSTKETQEIHTYTASIQNESILLPSVYFYSGQFNVAFFLISIYLLENVSNNCSNNNNNNTIIIAITCHDHTFYLNYEVSVPTYIMGTT